MRGERRQCVPERREAGLLPRWAAALGAGGREEGAGEAEVLQGRIRPWENSKMDSKLSAGEATPLLAVHLPSRA